MAKKKSAKGMPAVPRVPPIPKMSGPRPKRIVLNPTDDWEVIEMLWALDDIEEHVARLRRFINKIVRRRRARKVRRGARI